jgi:hypothetical protein
MMDVSDAVSVLRRALIETWPNLPADVREQLFAMGEMGTSPVDRIVRSAELIYARKSDMPVKMKKAAAKAFRVAGVYGFHGLDKGDRATLVAGNLEGTVAAADAPEPLAEFVPPQPLPATPPGGVPA